MIRMLRIIIVNSRKTFRPASLGKFENVSLILEVQPQRFMCGQRRGQGFTALIKKIKIGWKAIPATRVEMSQPICMEALPL